MHAVFPDAVRRFVLDQPGWVQFTVLILLADLANYLGHRALHEIPPLWRLHAVHHSSTDLDWLSTSRGHPLGQIINLVVTVVPLYAIGEAMPASWLGQIAAPFRPQARLSRSART
ncbi:conserved hypothetical protein [Parafrankia sp. Ea1.12]|uniref:sterol desaturase family protein n=1 Tax=Parafrankia sp. Ea1.12 TaxID=573499 RepID=UPI000DA5160D|nr:sterol desaturase family protein [Parafrankia sp. Ea1.12]SQD95804.1 conserved hypothetical protein [Parafrankia sp. Ea1.12]